MKMLDGTKLMGDKQTTRRERRIAARKQQIIEAAMQVFLAQGYTRATTKEIAEAADIAEGTIYNYFDSKEDLLLEMISYLADLDTRQQFFDESLDMDFREFLIEFGRRRQVDMGDRYDILTAIFPALMENPAVRQRYMDEIVTPAMTMLEDHFQQRIDRGQLKPIENLDLVVRLLASVSFGLWFLLILGEPVIQQATIQRNELLTEVVLQTVYDQFIAED